jgi:hypothetical protein
MAWKSREDKMPPPSFFSMMVAYLQRAYPGAQISRELMMTLRPFLIEAWRNGRTAEAAAQTTCSCDGRHIVPSPVVAVHIGKGSVRPPKGAQRGEVFGAESLRPPPRIERLQRQLDRVSREEQKRSAQASRWGQRAQKARTDTARQGAEREQGALNAKRADLLEEAKRMEAELQRLHRELNSPSMQRAVSAGSSPESKPAEKPAARPATPGRPPSASAEPLADRPKQQQRQGRGRRGSASADRATPPPSAGSVESQSAAVLGAVQGMLPNLAAQIAAQMVKEGGSK